MAIDSLRRERERDARAARQRLCMARCACGTAARRTEIKPGTDTRLKQTVHPFVRFHVPPRIVHDGKIISRDKGAESRINATDCAIDGWQFKAMTGISTTTIRPWSNHFRHDALEILASAQVNESYFGRRTPADMIAAYLDDFERIHPDTGSRLITAESGDGGLVGGAALIENVISIFISPHEWNRGVATELVRHMCELASARNSNPILALVQRENTASARVFEKSNFSFSGLFQGFGGFDQHKKTILILKYCQPGGHISQPWRAVSIKSTNGR